MSQRTKVVGTRAPIIWLLIVIAVVAMAALAVGGLVIYPQLQKEQDAEQHYQAGIAFQDVRDWEAAEAEYKQVISIDANYKDVQTRLAEAKSKQQEALAMEQAKTAQATATAQARAEATAAAATAEARMVQATSVAATATAQARATVQAQEVEATATAEALAQLEAHYQKGLGYINIGRWEEAKTELEQVFEVDPNFKEVQAKLAEVEGKLADIRALTPTTAPVTPTPVVVVSTNIAPEGRVEVSSVFPEQGGQCYQGSRAVDRVVAGYPAAPCNEWATNGERTGAWLKITFATARHINQVILYDRPNLDDHILEGTLSFSDGTTLHIGELPNDGSARKAVFEPKTVQWVQFTVDWAGGPNTGLAEIEVYGW